MVRICFIKVLLAVSTVLLLAGCGDGTTENHDDPEATGFSALLPSPVQTLAQLDPNRNTSAALLTQNGSSVLNSLKQHATSNGTACELDGDWTGPASTFSQLAYAGFVFNLSGFTGTPTLGLNWDTAPAKDTCWIGLSNFDAARWDWLPVSNPAGLFLPADLDPYVRDDSHEMLVVCVITSPDMASLATLTIGAEVYYEQEDNDTAASANNLPALPFTTDEVTGSIGTGGGYPGYDGDSKDFYALTISEPGMLELTVDLTKVTGTEFFKIGIWKITNGEPRTFYVINTDAGEVYNDAKYITESGPYWIVIESVGHAGDYGLGLAFGAMELFETEPNDTSAQANPLPALPVPWGAVLGSVGDTDTPDTAKGEVVYNGSNEDWYSFTVLTAIPVSVMIDEMFADLDLQLYSTDGITVLDELIGYNHPERVRALLPAAGTYYVRVMAAEGESYKHGNYFLSVHAGDGAGWVPQRVDDSIAADVSDCALALMKGFACWK